MSCNARFSEYRKGQCCSAAMLCVMRITLPALLFALCFAAEAAGQATWSLPKLKELDQSDAIGKGTVRLSAEETSLLRQLTRHITSACVADPGARPLLSPARLPHHE